MCISFIEKNIDEHVQKSIKIIQFADKTSYYSQAWFYLVLEMIGNWVKKYEQMHAKMKTNGML